MVLAHNHIYPHTKFKSSKYNTFEVIGIKYDFCAKKGHPADVERLATSHKTIGFQPLPISIHIPNLKALGIILLKLLEKNMIFVQKKAIQRMWKGYPRATKQ